MFESSVRWPISQYISQRAVSASAAWPTSPEALAASIALNRISGSLPSFTLFRTRPYRMRNSALGRLLVGPSLERRGVEPAGRLVGGQRVRAIACSFKARHAGRSYGSVFAPAARASSRALE